MTIKFDEITSIEHDPGRELFPPVAVITLLPPADGPIAAVLHDLYARLERAEAQAAALEAANETLLERVDGLEKDLAAVRAGRDRLLTTYQEEVGEAVYIEVS